MQLEIAPYLHDQERCMHRKCEKSRFGAGVGSKDIDLDFGNSCSSAQATKHRPYFKQRNDTNEGFILVSWNAC